MPHVHNHRGSNAARLAATAIEVWPTTMMNNGPTVMLTSMKRYSSDVMTRMAWGTVAMKPDPSARQTRDAADTKVPTANGTPTR
jgi:hypothetical protein